MLTAKNAAGEASGMNRTGRVIIGVLVVCALVGVIATVSTKANVSGVESAGSLAVLMKQTGKGPLFEGETEFETRERLKKELIANNEDPDLVDDLIHDLWLAKNSKDAGQQPQAVPDGEARAIYKGWSPLYGGHGGNWFQWDRPHGATIITVFCVRYQHVVNHISVRWNNDVVHHAGHNPHGHIQCYNVGHPRVDKCIGEVKVRSGALVDALEFYETTFKDITTGRLGGGGGGQHTVAGVTNCLVGVRGRVGWHLDQISFKYGV